MGFAFYSFCAISVLLLVGCITPPISSVKAASQDSYLSSEILNASELEDEPSVNFMVEHKPPSFVPYITLSLGLFSAALSVNYYCQKPIHFNNLTTPELVDVLMTKDEVIREIKRRLEPSKVNVIIFFTHAVLAQHNSPKTGNHKRGISSTTPRTGKKIDV